MRAALFPRTGFDLGFLDHCSVKFLVFLTNCSEAKSAPDRGRVHVGEHTYKFTLADICRVMSLVVASGSSERCFHLNLKPQDSVCLAWYCRM